MKKHFRLLAIVLLMMCFFVIQPNKASAVLFVDIDFYYQAIEGVYETGSDIDVNEKNGESLVVSSSDSNYTYKVRRVKIKNEADLIRQMAGEGATEDDLAYGQKCILESYRAATSPEMKEKRKTSYLHKLEIDLTDTSYVGKDIPDELKDRDGKGLKTGPYKDDVEGLTPNIQDDFWPCSYKNRIILCDSCDKYFDPNDETDVAEKRGSPSGIEQAYSTVFHEYAHFMDNTNRGNDTYNYGLDNTHYLCEVTTERMAFIEGWAEYNEMILDKYDSDDENEKKANAKRQSIFNQCSEDSYLWFESTVNQGEYRSYVKVSNASFSTLLKSEAFDAYLLYKLACEIGQDRINKVFVDTRWNNNRTVSDVVKRLVQNKKKKADSICKVVDDVYYGKIFEDDDGNFSTINFYKMVGATEETRAYAEKREKGEDTTPNEDDTDTEFDETLRYIKIKTDEFTQELVENGKELVEKGKEKIEEKRQKEKERNEKLKENFTKVVDIVKDKITELAENDKEKREALKTKLSEFFSNIGSKLSAPVKNNSIFQKFLNMFKKMLGIETDEVEDTKETEDESVEGIAIESTNISNEDLENSNENIEVEGSSNNPFDE